MATGLNLGIAGRTALVCGSAAGLGRACAHALSAAGAEVIINGRTLETLKLAASQISTATNTAVRFVQADVTTPQGRDLLLAACPSPDILVTNAAGPKPGDFRHWDEGTWRSAVDANMIAPIMLIRATIGAMTDRRWGRIINITSASVKAPLPLLGLSNGARSGLTGFVAGAAREVAQYGVTINNLLPGNFATDRLRAYVGALAQQSGISAEDAMSELEGRIPARRVGEPAEFGAVCAFIASVHASYLTGQNILLDGGAYPGTL